MKDGWGRAIGDDLWRQKVGIVGLGRIGRGVAQRVHGFEAEILAYEPYPDRAFCEQYGVKLVSAEDLFRRERLHHAPPAAQPRDTTTSPIASGWR